MENDKFRILLDPTGGLYLDERVDQWIFQKKRVSGIQPDLVTSEIGSIAFDLLRTVGLDVLATRCLRHSKSEIGASGEPLFHEGAGQYLQHCRLRPDLRERPGTAQLPPRVWDDGADNLEKDARARLNFRDHVKPDLMIAIGTSRQAEDPGLEVTHNGVGDVEELSDLILKEVAKRTRRGVHGTHMVAGSNTPMLTLYCGSMSDLRTIKRLSSPWYRLSVAQGLFAALWKHAAGARRVEAALR